jgi:iron complex outermembrane recepter protein
MRVRHVGPSSIRSVARPTLCLAVAIAVAASASAAAGEATGDDEVAEVVVTGTRLARDGLTAPTPVTVIGAERAQALGATNIGALLNTLPAFRASSNPQTANINPRGAGTSLADLRGLGATRTLVMVNGRRFVPSTLEGTVDLNQIPTLMIERSEIVTGGASAQYGSDAVAGVVNLITQRKIDGLRTQLQYGRTEAGDNGTLLAGLAGGFAFAGDRGHFTAGVEFEDSDGTGNCYTRAWCAQEYQVVTNPRTPAAGYLPNFPVNNILPGTHTVTAVPGGLIVGGAGAAASLRGTAFRPDGTPYAFQYGTVFPNNSTFMVGGEGYNGFIAAPLMVIPVQRLASLFRADYSLTETLESSFEFSYGRVEAQGQGAQTRDTSAGSTIGIRGDNAFLPAALRTTMTSRGIPLTSATSFTLGRMGDDFGTARNSTDTELFRVLGSLKGALAGSWTWDAYYQYGQTKYDQTVANNRIQQQVPGVPLASGPGVSCANNIAACSRIQLAADAVVNPANGQVVCRSTLTNPNNGCVPVNLFGLNRYSDAAKAYLYGTGTYGLDFTQHVAAANVQGDLFETWAGVVPLAAGVEYRSSQVRTSGDPITTTSGFYVSNSSLVNGTIDVAEGYLETSVPLLREKPGARTLELNGALRYTDYNTSGDVTTWKYGVVYEPLSWLRARATKSRDIRAPNTDELYRGLTTGFQTIDGILTPTTSGGNRSLVPEEADTLTLGLAVRGEGAFDGLRFSVDYYDIDVADAIATLTGQLLVNRCRQSGAYCDQVTFNPNGSVGGVSTVFLNLNRLQVSGFDYELGYRLPLDRLGALRGDLDFTLLATRVSHLTTTDATGLKVDRAGVTGNNVSGGGAGMPRWQVNALVGYNLGPASVNLEVRHIDSGLFDATLIGPEQRGYNISLPNSINTNVVASATYVNLGARYRLEPVRGYDIELFAGVQNLLDRTPPAAPSNQGSSNLLLFDALGRSYRAGVRIGL